MYNSKEVPLRGQLMCMKTMPLIRTYMHNSREAPLRGRMYPHRETAFKRAANVCVKQCLWLGLTYMTLEKFL